MPALTGAIEIVRCLVPGSSGNVSAAYGIVYPYSMISIVLVVQFLPKLLRRNVVAEKAAWTARHKVQLAGLVTKLLTPAYAPSRRSHCPPGAVVRCPHP